MSRLAELLNSNDPAANSANPANLPGNGSSQGAEIRKIRNFRKGAFDNSNFDAVREARRKAVLNMLETDPGMRWAMQTFDDASSDYIIIAYAVRGVGTCELSILKERYDAFRFAEMLGELGGAAS